MSFWSLSDGNAANENVDTSYQKPGVFELIPDKSSVLAEIVGASWQSAYQSDEKFIEIIWSVIEPKQVANARVRQKLWVTDLDPNASDKEKAIKKRDRARQTLARIDAFGKERLMRSGKDDFSDDDLALALHGIKAVLFVTVWEMNGNTGNAVMNVNPQGSDVSLGDTPAPKKSPPASGSAGQGSGGGFSMDDEIPF